MLAPRIATGLAALILGAIAGCQNSAPSPSHFSPSAAAPPAVRTAAPIVPLAAKPASAGPWEFWADCSSARQFGAGARTLWSATGSCIWRFDVATGEIRAFTPFDGLPLAGGGPGKIAVAPDDSCAAQMADGVYLYRAGKWHHLPPITRQYENIRLAFDLNNTLHVAAERSGNWRFLEWRNDQWILVAEAKLPPMSEVHNGFAPIDQGYFVQVQVTGAVASYFVTAGAAPRRYVPSPPSSLRGFNIEGKIISEGRGRNGERVYSTLTPESFHVEFSGMGVDLTGKSYLKRVELTQAPWIGVASTADDSALTEGIVIREQGEYVVRDAVGRIWIGANCWDGKAWTLVHPALHFHQPWFTLAGPGNRLAEFDWDTMKITADARPGETRGYDAATHTGWVIRLGAPRWQLKSLGTKEQTVLDIPAPPFDNYPEWRDPAGGWWWTGHRRPSDGSDQHFILQIDARGGLHSYRIPADENRAGPDVFLSPNGNVWRRINNAYARYDREKDDFIIDTPWTDFGFDFGPWRLAAIPGAVANTLFRREADGSWRPLGAPFDNGTLACHPLAIRGDRMLVTSNHGILEYDVTHDAWALLQGRADLAELTAFFDPRGRRVIVGSGYMLRYTGDPIEAQQRDLAQLLILMDNETSRVREEASQRLKQQHPLLLDRLKAIADDLQYSEEVRSRVNRMLSQTQDKPIPLTGLLRTMHPLVGPPPGATLPANP